MRVTIQGGKILERATLTLNGRQNHYRLEGKGSGASGSAVEYAGTLDSSGKLLELYRAGNEGQERLTLRANSNYVRYTITLDRKEAGAAVSTALIEVGLTKEGELFAAGSMAVEKPRCIVTGGAATLTVSYEGQSYPICCTGCRDEFLENPEKYLKKLAKKTSPAGGGKTVQPKASRVSRFEDAFAGDADETEAKPKPEMAGRGGTSVVPAQVKENEATKPLAKPQTRERTATRAATALRLAENLEKTGKADAALKSYRQIVKDYPGSRQAKTAAERVKALEKR
jgi:YHS domain-containing protein